MKKLTKIIDCKRARTLYCINFAMQIELRRNLAPIAKLKLFSDINILHYRDFFNSYSIKRRFFDIICLSLNLRCP